jgi:hypothetical protein
MSKAQIHIQTDTARKAAIVARVPAGMSLSAFILMSSELSEVHTTPAICSEQWGDLAGLAANLNQAMKAINRAKPDIPVQLWYNLENELNEAVIQLIAARTSLLPDAQKD